MKSIPILIVALIIAIIVPNVCAENVTYSQEYYDLNTQANELWAQQNPYVVYSYYAINSVWLKLSANQIALEKQNELINEPNELLKNLTTMHYYCVMDNPGSYRPYNCSPMFIQNL